MFFDTEDTSKSNQEARNHLEMIPRVQTTKSITPESSLSLNPTLSISSNRNFISKTTELTLDQENKAKRTQDKMSEPKRKHKRNKWKRRPQFNNGSNKTQRTLSKWMKGKVPESEHQVNEPNPNQDLTTTPHTSTEFHWISGRPPEPD